MYSEKLKFIFQIIISSILASLSIVGLIYSLNWISTFHAKNHFLAFLIPLVCLLTVFAYKKFVAEFKSGVPRLYDEIHTPLLYFPKRIAPLTYVFTCLSHLVGASVGREGAALIIGVSFSDRVAAFFSLDRDHRHLFLMSMLAASFSSALASPIAGLFFALETSHQIKNIFKSNTWFILLASLTGFGVRSFFTNLRDLQSPLSAIHYDFKIFVALLFFGLLTGLFARIFIKFLSFSENYFHKLLPHHYWRPLIFSFILMGLYQFSQFDHARGLGLSNVDDFLTGTPQNLTLLFNKFIATIISLLSELKGGEFVPMVYMGAIIGNWYGNFLNISPIMFAMAGYVAVFAGASHAPLAMSFVALSLFGAHAFFPCLIVCLMSNLFSGKVSVYKQRSLSRLKN